MAADYILDMGQSTDLVIGATGVSGILQNVRVILSTIKGSVPLDRGFGISATFLDLPLPEAMAALGGEIVDAVERDEPRVIITQVDLQASTESARDGRLYPVVRVRILEEYLDVLG